MFKKIKRYLANPYLEFGKLIYGLFPKIMPDRYYLIVQYYYTFGKTPNLDTPSDFNEKLLWIKLYDRKPIYTTMVDKFAVKEWATSMIGEKYVIKNLGVWKKFRDIDFDTLPNKFVLKCTHDSGSYVICKDKTKFDKEKAELRLTKCLKKDFYLIAREWPYKNVPRRIIAEEYLEDSNNSVLTDYKWFCFNGEPKIMYISNDQLESPTTDFFDMNFNRLPIRMRDGNSVIPPKKPLLFDEMKRIAKVLSKDTMHVRVDFYIINNALKLGELTFFHNGGYSSVQPDDWNKKLGDWISIDK